MCLLFYLLNTLAIQSETGRGAAGAPVESRQARQLINARLKYVTHTHIQQQPESPTVTSLTCHASSFRGTSGGDMYLAFTSMPVESCRCVYVTSLER